MNSYIAVFVLLLGILGTLPRAMAQNSGAADSLQQRLEELDQKLRIVQRQWELEKENAVAIKKETPVLIAGQEGFTLKSADGASLLKLRAHTQTDGRFFLDDEAESNLNTFLIRRIRFLFEGTFAKIYDFRLMPDFASSRLVLQDAYLDARLWPQLKFKAGKFKTPFGLERLQSPTTMLFIERALPNNLVPNRDIGIQLHGDVAGGVLNYMAGIFNGVVDGGSAEVDAYDSKDVAGRVMISPFLKTENALAGLSLGITATSGTQNGSAISPNLPAYNTPGQQTLFRYRSDGTPAGTVIANGEVHRYSPQGYWSWGRLGLLGEYVVSSIEVNRAATSAKLANRAWQVAASYALTGEAASYKGIVPKRSFDRAKGTWGSFEIAGRYSVLEVDEDAFPVFANPQSSAQKASAWAVGLNWYWNRNVRLMVNYEQTSFKGGAAAGDREEETAVLTRFQVAY